MDHLNTKHVHYSDHAWIWKYVKYFNLQCQSFLVSALCSLSRTDGPSAGSWVSPRCFLWQIPDSKYWCARGWRNQHKHLATASSTLPLQAVPMFELCGVAASRFARIKPGPVFQAFCLSSLGSKRHKMSNWFDEDEQLIFVVK